ncbi:MAG: bifunctional DNA primase/polymerase, partial [bacterium]|nr:bifunctional DNA primase/polymerase [bacterium]
MRSDLLQAALAYLHADLSVIPVKADGTKAPALPSWKRFQQELPTESEVREWFSNGLRGVGVVAGAVSRNLAVLDFDDDSAWFAFVDLCIARGFATWTYDLPCAKTPAGHHLYFRAPEPLPTQVLARDEAGNTLIELRGEGAYA